MKKFNTRIIILFAIAAQGSHILYCKTIERSVSVSIVEEKINGERFTHRSDLIDGKAQDLWSINGQNVNYEEYQNAIADAQLAENRLMRHAQEEQRKREQRFKMQAHYDILKKIVQNLIVEINKELTKLKNILLIPFLQFSQDTIRSQDALYELEQKLTHADDIVQRFDSNDIQLLREISNDLELYPEKLVKLYQDSVNYAIKTCDNTKELKEFLTLVS